MAPRQAGKWSKQEYYPALWERRFNDWYENGPSGVCLPRCGVECAFCGGYYSVSGIRDHQRRSKKCAEMEAAWLHFLAEKESEREGWNVVAEPAKKRLKRETATAAGSDGDDDVEIADAPWVIRPRGRPKYPTTRASAKRGVKAESVRGPKPAKQEAEGAERQELPESTPNSPDAASSAEAASLKRSRAWLAAAIDSLIDKIEEGDDEADRLYDGLSEKENEPKLLCHVKHYLAGKKIDWDPGAREQDRTTSGLLTFLKKRVPTPP